MDTGLLFFNEAGITLQALNVRLDNQSPPVAMPTLGGSAGQTIAGAISTGTHGSDFDRAPIADCVRALYIIGAGGTHHWVESKSNQFTDPNKVTATFPSIALANCHYDDDLFNAAIVGMGAMGVIYAVVLEVVPQFALIEFNLWSTWEQLQQNGIGGVELTRVAHGQAFPSIGQFLDGLYPPNDPSGMPYSRALQVVINPIKNDDGTHNCYATIRFELPMGLVPESWVLPVGVVPGDLSTLTLDELKNAIINSPDCGLPQKIAFQFANISGNTILEQCQSLINFCKSYNYFWAVRAVIDLMMQTAFPQYNADDSPAKPAGRRRLPRHDRVYLRQYKLSALGRHLDRAGVPVRKCDRIRQLPRLSVLRCWHTGQHFSRWLFVAAGMRADSRLARHAAVRRVADKPARYG